MVQESQLFLQDAVKQLNQENLDFVLFGGDQVELPGKDDENWQLFIDIVQSLNCPWNFVLGEHDVSGVVNKMDTYGRDWKGKGITSPKAYWSHDAKAGVHIVGLDTSQSDLTVGALSDPQLEWLKKDLDDNRGKFSIVVSHHPLLPPAPFDSGPPWEDWTVPQGANAREIMAAHADVRMALSGHVHISKIQQEEKIWYVSSSSLGVYPCAYRIFRVTPQSINVETYQISYGALIKKAKKAIESWSLAYKYSSKLDPFYALMEGGKEDQNAKLSLTSSKKVAIEQPKRKKKERDEDKEKDKDKVKDQDQGKDKGKSKEKRKDKKKKGSGDNESRSAEKTSESTPRPAPQEPPQPIKKEEPKAQSAGQAMPVDQGSPKPRAASGPGEVAKERKPDSVASPKQNPSGAADVKPLETGN